MEKLWKGRFSKRLDKEADDYNTSLPFDIRLYSEDIDGSKAHAAMLCAQGIISSEDLELITEGLEKIRTEISNGDIAVSPEYEDIHSLVETILTERIGDAGKRLHTARSRNDQVALDLRLALRSECDKIDALLCGMIECLAELADAHCETIMPGYTHLQRAQPITFGHHLCAYAFMFLRDRDRLSDCRRRMNISPLGSAALAGTTYNIDRRRTAELLYMEGVSDNSLDGVSDRDFAVEFVFCMSLIMTHLSRFAEEVILWSSWEFRFIELDDAFSTGSSIMPQKKNADIAELSRGKTGRVYGSLIALLTVLKGLPLAYNKDMQEDKEQCFDAADTVKMSLSVFAPMLASARVNKENMRRAAASGFINATDGADYLVGKGLAFRDAYKIMGEIVSYCAEKNITLEEVPLEVYREKSELFEADYYEAIKLENCVSKRSSEGGTSPESVKKQIEIIRSKL